MAMFITKSKRFLPELGATLTELVHEGSGARLMHIDATDSENLFAIGFQTLPSSDTGVAHILEHTVLCGSTKFPVKDPFFAMTRRSLATYMNALTGSDFTLYPAASELKKDFYNLLTVYIDALFHPLLRRESFLQEGWRLEFTDIRDSSTPLTYRGVVYNEMKGAMASLDARLWAQITKRLFPTSTYGYNSGGEPEAIPSLSYEELLAFYKTYYHPSRALFFFYGNFPLDEHLTFLEEHLLKHVDKLPPLPPVPCEKRFIKPLRDRHPYPINENEPLEERLALVLGFLTCPITDQVTWLSLQLLETLLTGSDGSFFKKSLLESGLCESVDSAVDADAAELPFIFIFKGLKEDHVALLETKVFEILKNIRSFSPDEIAAVLHQFELERLEITGGSYPFGLSLCFRSVLLKLHGSDPLSGLELHNQLEKLRELCQDPSYLPGLIKKYFLENPHFVSLTMVPDPKLTEKEEAAEKRRLSHIQLTEEAKKALVDQAIRLDEKREDPTDLLPKLALSDVARVPKTYALAQKEAVFTHKTFTNGLLYATLSCPLPQMGLDELHYTKLYLSLLGEIGTKKRSFDDLLLQEQLYSAGFGAQISFEPKAHNFCEAEAKVFFKMKGLQRNEAPLFALFREILTETSLHEKERIQQLIKQQILSLESSLTRNALRYASSASTASFSPYLGLYYLMGGTHYLQFLRTVDKTGVDALISRLQELPHLLTQGSQLVITAEEEPSSAILSCCTAPLTPFVPELLSLPEERNYKIATAVAFNAFSLPLFSYDHEDAAAVSLSAHLMEHLVLHPLIREQGGAYGARASASSSGHFTFSTYRDPHIASSQKAFKTAAVRIASGDFTEEELEEAKFSILQDLDTPIAPGQRGDAVYYWRLSGKTDQLRTLWRRRLLDATADMVQKASKTHILDNFEKGVFVTFAGKGVV